jgi:hypothetical protein
MARDNPPAIAPAGTVHCDMESYMKFVQAHMDGENGRPTPLGIRQDTFKILHTPYPPSSPNDVLYTYGSWFYLEGAADWWSRSPLLWHNGSNRFHYSQIHMALVANEARAFFMNIGHRHCGAVFWAFASHQKSLW